MGRPSPLLTPAQRPRYAPPVQRDPSARPRLRFAPSPTGPLHLGGARTALFNWIYARRHGGTLVLRIENTDVLRSSEEFEQGLKTDLRWLGIEWDEGPDAGGPHAPYRQTDRLEHYQRAFERLKEAGHVYPCFATAKELEAIRAEQLRRGEPPHYPGTYRDLDPAERERRLAQGHEHTWRFALPEGSCVIEDLVHERVEFAYADMGDFIIRRSDGTFTYLFASAVDDADMDITHVIRGTDGLPNAPRQIALIEALGHERPIYAHLPLLTDMSGKKLSKRDPSHTIEALRERQVPPDALVLYLAGLGYPPASQPGMTVAELVRSFDISRVSRSPAKVDYATLEAVSGRVLRDLPPGAFMAVAREKLAEAGLSLDERPGVEEAVVGAFQTEVTTWEELVRWINQLVGGRLEWSDDAEAAMSGQHADQVLRALAAANEEVADQWSGEAVMDALRRDLPEVKGRALFQPVRAALTGELHGPELKHLITILGPERVRTRVTRALAQLHMAD